ncbi:MAG: SLC13 family permease [Gammaproteobacteria bacterium]|nr:SLC13 family permease [Gammaproteobacteria bacterium]
MFARPTWHDDGPVTLRNRIGLWLGPLAFVLILAFTDLDPGNPMVTRMVAITAWMAIWWISEAIPIAATALMPLVLFPAMGIMRGRHTDASRQVDFGDSALSGGLAPGDLSISLHNVVSQYMSWVTFLLLGGFLVAIAVQKWDLHKRIALNILRVMGNRLDTLILGFMLAAALLSMWLSNTATTMMLLPIALSVVLLREEFHAAHGATDAPLHPRERNFSFALLLGLAYAASIGGMATLTGTPPNAILVAQFEQLYPHAPPISFASWSMMAMPFSFLFLGCAWLLLTRLVFPLPPTGQFSGGDLIARQHRELGPMSPEEKRVLAVFVTLVVLWFTRKKHLFGSDVEIFGWSHYLDLFLARLDISAVGSMLDDGTVAIAMALLLFALPAKSTHGRLLDADDVNKVPWGVLILFGGGLALAKGFGVSGLSSWAAQQFEILLHDSSSLVVVMSTVGFITSLTELTSNTATTSTAIPIMASLAQGIEVHPLLLLIPTALAASCAFMLPISTPPNAIVYGSRRVPIIKMIIAGVWLDILSVVILTTLVFSLGHWVFGLLGEVPGWALQ